MQLAALWIYARVFGIEYIAATVLAVETAVLHNFIWHEAWTWRGMAVHDRWRRLVRFHAGNGLVSIVSNALFTWLFRQFAGLPLIPSNIAAIVCTAIINFAIAELWVFREHRTERP